MTIAENDDRWLALAAALKGLVEASGAVNAVVADTSENLWCRAIEMNTYETIGVDRLWRTAMTAASLPMNQGARITLSHTVAEPYVCARSFAGIYLRSSGFGALSM